ncbi:hypothetical protein OE699_01890 [Sedimentimonas flavescens]|uniref:Helix-turn-helix protein n=1 Tax=Sedimentimonas flavescens TaxID=2851012 RepID=A0ABT2ZWA7_9RHOB|nr:hypothetical protein [Sedimentimonas flavescens]MCV2877590.1 hypothetical protein [Sedimentimonas flavescens]
MSHANPFDGRGRGRAAHRRAHGWAVEPDAYRVAFCGRWQGLMQHLFRTREDVASAFGVTFQTACNWWDGTNRPSGDRVALAAITWPEEFARFMGV